MRLVIGIGIVLLSALCLRLGFWQLDRAEEAETRSALVRSREALEPVLIEGPQAGGRELLFRRAIVRGRLETDDRFWVADRKQDGRRGFHQIVPLHIADSEMRILVNRGWVPSPHAPNGEVPPIMEIEGLLVRPALPALRLAGREEDFGDQWPYLDPARYAESRDVPVAPLVLVGDKRLARDLLEAEYSRADKWSMHIGYALQWFAFAVLSLLFLVVLAKTSQKAD